MIHLGTRRATNTFVCSASSSDRPGTIAAPVVPVGLGTIAGSDPKCE